MSLRLGVVGELDDPLEGRCLDFDWRRQVVVDLGH